MGKDEGKSHTMTHSFSTVTKFLLLINGNCATTLFIEIGLVPYMNHENY